MFGIAFIIVGIIILLQALGYLGSISAGVVWGIAFIVIGISFALRHAARHKRWEERRAKRREARDISSEQ